MMHFCIINIWKYLSIKVSTKTFNDITVQNLKHNSGLQFLHKLEMFFSTACEFIDSHLLKINIISIFLFSPLSHEIEQKTHIIINLLKILIRK